MKRIILGLMLLLGASAHAAIPGLSSSTAQGGASTTNASTSIVAPITVPLGSLNIAGIYELCGGYGAANTANAYFGMYSMYGPVSNTPFQVPAGLNAYGISGWVNGGAATGISAGTSTAPLSAENVTTTPTGAVYYGNNAVSQWSFIPNPTTANVDQNFSMLGVKFPGGTYIWVRNGATGGLGVCFTVVVQ